MAIVARRPQARKCVFSALSIERDTIEFHPMVNETETELFSNLPLQGFKFGGFTNSITLPVSTSIRWS